MVDGLKSVSNNPTEADYVKHNTRIDNHIIEGNKLLFIAHSQGNLFVNQSHKHALTKILDSPNAVKTVHISPASLLLNSAYVLTDKDRVINAIRLLDAPNIAMVIPDPKGVEEMPAITHNIPPYAKRPSGSNDKTDFLVMD